MPRTSARVSELVQALQETPFFCGLPPTRLRELALGCELFRSEPRDLLWRELEPVPHLVLVVEGAVEVCRLSRALRSVPAGRLVGLSHVLSRSVASADLRAHTASGAVVALLGADQVNGLVDEHPAMLRRAIYELSDIIRALTLERDCGELPAHDLVLSQLRLGAPSGTGPCQPSDLAGQLRLHVKYVRKVLRDLERTNHLQWDRRNKHVTLRQRVSAPPSRRHRLVVIDDSG